MSDEILEQMNDEERARQEAVRADYRHRVRVWSGLRGAKSRWGTERSKSRRVKVYEADADALVRLAQERRSTVADVVKEMVAAFASGAR